MPSRRSGRGVGGCAAPTATSGLAASRAEPIRRRPARAGRATSTGSSSSDEADPRTPARSTQTWASRGRADGERDRQQHVLVGLTDERAESRRGVDIGRVEHARNVELAQQARCTEGQPGVVDVERADRQAFSGSSVEEIAESDDQGRRRPPREHTARVAVDPWRGRPTMPRRNR